MATWGTAPPKALVKAQVLPFHSDFQTQQKHSLSFPVQSQLRCRYVNQPACQGYTDPALGCSLACPYTAWPPWVSVQLNHFPPVRPVPPTGLHPSSFCRESQDRGFSSALACKKLPKVTLFCRALCLHLAASRVSVRPRCALFI